MIISYQTIPNRYLNFQHYAARGGHLDVCRALLDHGASVNAQTRSGGVTALQRAAYRGHIDICRLLLQVGADSRITDMDGKTALHKVRRFKEP